MPFLLLIPIAAAGGAFLYEKYIDKPETQNNYTFEGYTQEQAQAIITGTQPAGNNQDAALKMGLVAGGVYMVYLATKKGWI